MTSSVTKEVMMHVGFELGGMARSYRERAFIEEGAGGLGAEERAAFSRKVADTYHELEQFLMGKLESMMESEGDG